MGADSFRIGSLQTIMRTLASMSISGPEMEACVVAMVDYVRRSVAKSPRMMREDGDVCRFLSELARYAKDQPDVDLEGFLVDFDIPALCRNASRRDRESLRRDLAAVGVVINL